MPQPHMGQQPAYGQPSTGMPHRAPTPYPTPHYHQAAPLPPQQMRSHGENAAAAAVVTSAPIHPPDLAATSLMDEDEDIPTVVAQPRGPDSEPGRGPRPAAGMSPHAMGQPPAWNGASTQLMGGDPGTGFDSTIALPDSAAASEISSKVDELDRQIMQHQRPAHPMDYSQAPMHHQQPPPQYPGGYNAPNTPRDPGMNMDGSMHQRDMGQGAIETKMSLPRPAAVAQWLMEQGDVEIGGPRSTGVIIAIAALATLCVMGVISLIVHKLRVPPQPDPAAVTAPQTTGATLPTDTSVVVTNVEPVDQPAVVEGSRTSEPGASKSTKAEPAPGKLTIDCRPPCDSVAAAGQSFGPSPVFNQPLSPGVHRVTVTREGMTKTLAVEIVSGRLTQHTVAMR